MLDALGTGEGDKVLHLLFLITREFVLEWRREEG
jgi:hypothetical protein